MTMTSIVTMILILGFVIGGFIYFLVMAIRKEAGEKENTSSLSSSEEGSLH